MPNHISKDCLLKKIKNGGGLAPTALIIFGKPLNSKSIKNVKITTKAWI